MKCFISGKETKSLTKGVPVHRDHREEFKQYCKEKGHPTRKNLYTAIPKSLRPVAIKNIRRAQHLATTNQTNNLRTHGHVDHS